MHEDPEVVRSTSRTSRASKVPVRTLVRVLDGTEHVEHRRHRAHRRFFGVSALSLGSTRIPKCYVEHASERP